jgi:hypothetical protein
VQFILLKIRCYMIGKSTLRSSTVGAECSPDTN